MKKTIILLFLIVTCTTNTWAQKIEAEVKEEIELMSVLARLAGYEEYGFDYARGYTADIDSVLGKYRSHEAVEMMKLFSEKYGLGYDRVMSIALQIECRGDSIVKLDTGKKSISPISEQETSAFLSALNDFCHTSRFNDFFDAHSYVYEPALRLFNDSIMKHFDQEWYTRFYGTPPAEQFRIVIGFVNGPSCYGPSRQLVGQSKEVFSIIGYAANRKGQPVLMADLGTVVHEFNHSFIKIKGDTKNALAKSGKVIKSYSSFCMKQQAYDSWQTILEESLVRAAEKCYFIEHGNGKVDKFIRDEMSHGFYWMPELVQTLRYYESHRKKYPTFTSFYPEIVRFFDRYVADREKEIQKALK